MTRPTCASIVKRLLLIAIGLVTACQSTQILETPSAQAPSPPSDAVALAAQSVALGDADGSLTYDGRQRTYRLFTPKSYRHDRPLPLVLAFHGYGSQGKDLEQNVGLNDLATQHGFLVVYPDGIDRRWNPFNKFFTGVDDVGFVPALIAHLQQIRAIDTRRIYATGVSNGGFLVQRLACESNRTIAAFASVAATLPSQLRDRCNPPRAVPMLMINGTADQKVPWTGGNLPYGSIQSVPDTIAFWQQHNACPTTANAKSLPNSRVEIDRYATCKAGAEVELVKLKGAGHIWPRGGSGPTELLNGSQEIWQFFQRHPLPPP